MRTTLFLTIAIFFNSLYVNAGINPTIKTAHCLVCEIPAGLTAGDLTGTSAALSWDAVAGATQYTVEVEDEQNNPSTFHIETNVSGTSYTVTGLTAGVSYKFKVRAKCGGDNSDWSDWVFFASSGSGGGGGNGGGDCAIPTGLTVTVDSGTATLGWTAVPGAVKYTIEVEDEQNNPGTFHLEDSTLTNSYTLSGLQAGVQYKFKVRAKCAGGQSDWSDWVFFNGSGGGNGGGDCVAPTALTASVLGSTATLSWNVVTGAVSYYIEVEDEQNNPSNFHLEDSTLTNSYTLTGLQAGVLYKFKVRTKCAGGQSDWSGWQFFNGNIGSPGGGGGTGDCVKPTGTLATNITANSALLTWNAVPGVATYNLEIERVNPGSTPFQVTVVVSTNSYLISGLLPNTRYKFKVRSNCSADSHSKWTGWRKFRTLVSLTDADVAAAQPDATVEDRGTAIAQAFTLQLWPNPVQTSATVRLEGLDAQSATLRVFDLAGQLLQERNIQAENGAWQGALTLGDLPNGVYLLQARTVQNTRTVKIVVSH